MTRIVNAVVLTEPGTTIRDAEVEFSSTVGTVSYLGPTRGPVRIGDLDAAGRVLIPGMTNGHTHSAMTLLRGYSDDVPLHTWLTHSTLR